MGEVLDGLIKVLVPYMQEYPKLTVVVAVLLGWSFRGWAGKLIPLGENGFWRAFGVATVKEMQDDGHTKEDVKQSEFRDETPLNATLDEIEPKKERRVSVVRRTAEGVAEGIPGGPLAMFGLRWLGKRLAARKARREAAARKATAAKAA